MDLKRYHITAVLLILFSIIPVKPFSQQIDNIQYTFTQTDSGYAFYGSFISEADAGCLLEICFEYEHIRALASDAQEVLLIDQGENWNRILYRYRKFIWFENESSWHRKIDPEKQRVDFTLLSSINNSKIMPMMLSSSGFYQVSVQDTGSLVEYHQQCTLSESPLTRIYLDRAKVEAVRFIYYFSEYLNEYCLTK
ncbi:MAG: hypothetical protein JXB19_01660 [Bacteroidales bacterium]|nr:hypothetical protein [Bacteroidales bacterium]